MAGKKIRFKKKINILVILVYVLPICIFLEDHIHNSLTAQKVEI